jgi:hypothetical protein
MDEFADMVISVTILTHAVPVPYTHSCPNPNPCVCASKTCIHTQTCNHAPTLCPCPNPDLKYVLTLTHALILIYA